MESNEMLAAFLEQISNGSGVKRKRRSWLCEDEFLGHVHRVCAELKPGDFIWLYDGQGICRRGVFMGITRNRASVTFLDDDDDECGAETAFSSIYFDSPEPQDD